MFSLALSNAPAMALQAYGITAATLNLRTLSADTLTLATGERVTDAPAFPYGETLTLYRAGAKVFQGRITAITRKGTSDSETTQYTISGPWDALEKLVYEENWRVGQFTGGTPGTPMDGETPTEDLPTFTATDAPLTRILLGYSLDGQRIPGQEILAAILDYAAAQGILLKGALNAPLFIPPDDVRDQTCAALIGKVMQWHPAHTAYFDYSTTPPTFHCRPNGHVGETIDARKDLLEIPTLTPRHDLQAGGVHITYTRVNSAQDSNGNAVEATDRIVDKYPETITGRELTTLRFFIDLEGFSTSSMAQKIKTEEPLINSLEWWKKNCPDLKDARIKSLKIVPGTAKITADDQAFSGVMPTRRLLSGAIADWMRRKDVPAHITADFDFTLKDKTYIKTTTNKTLTIGCHMTDAGSRTFSKTQQTAVGETPIPNFARDFYDQLKTLQHEGKIQLNNPEARLDIPLGAHLTIPGLFPGITLTANEVSADLDSGATTIQCGPPQWRTPADWLEFLRANRTRNSPSAASISQRKTGTYAAPDVDKLPDTPAKADTTPGEGATTSTTLGNVTITDTKASAASASAAATTSAIAAADAAATPDLKVSGPAHDLTISTADILAEMHVRHSEILGAYVLMSAETGTGGGGGTGGQLRPIAVTKNGNPHWSISPGHINNVPPLCNGVRIGSSADPAAWAAPIGANGYLYATAFINADYTRFDDYQIIFSATRHDDDAEFQTWHLIGQISGGAVLPENSNNLLLVNSGQLFWWANV
jgi:hypothetical protein